MYRIPLLCMLFALFAVVSALASPLVAQDLSPMFEARVFRTAAGTELPYRLFVPPKYDPRRRYPLLIWLHGGAARGTDNLSQIGLGNVDAVAALTADSIQRRHPAFVLAPQVPPDGAWRAAGPDTLATTTAAMLQIIEQLASEFSIDRRRLYLLGHSLGGHGTWDLLAKRPAHFAAAVPIMGAGDTTIVTARPRAAIWAFAGVLDTAVRIERTRAMVRAFERTGAVVRFTEYPDGRHDVTPRVFLERGFFTWLFRQRLK